MRELDAIYEAERIETDVAEKKIDRETYKSLANCTTCGRGNRF